MWEGGARPNYCVLPEHGDILDKVVYTLTNPVKAGIIPQHHLWPGAISNVAQIEKGEHHHEAPEEVLRQDRRPDAAHAGVGPHAGAGTGRDECQGLRALSGAAGRGDGGGHRRGPGGQGRELVRAQGVPGARPVCCAEDEVDAILAEPKVSSKHEESRNAMILRLKQFRSHYGEAKRAFRSGNRDAPFPQGTFAMRVYWDVALEPQV